MNDSSPIRNPRPRRRARGPDRRGPAAAGPAAGPAGGRGAQVAGAGGIPFVFPGLGHLYLGLYQRAFAIGGAFILGISMTSHGSGRASSSAR